MSAIDYETEFEVLHDWLKTKRAFAERELKDLQEEDDDSRKAQIAMPSVSEAIEKLESEIEVANRWLRELFDKSYAVDAREEARARRKLQRWNIAVNGVQF